MPSPGPVALSPLGHRMSHLARRTIRAGRRSDRGPVLERHELDPAEALLAIGELKRLLEDNLIPFWSERVLDIENGGYRFPDSVTGEWSEAATKHVITQSRTLWFFSHLLNRGFGTEAHRRVARQGFDFLVESMWDEAAGGFLWEVDPTGRRAVKSGKHVIGQAMALYALSEYERASGDLRAGWFERRLFELLEERAHDGRFGGYLELFRRDWTPAPPDWRGYLGAPPGLKLMNTHMHVMEALSASGLLDRELARTRLIELILVNSNAVVRKPAGACTNRHLRDWRPSGRPRTALVSYGHDLENVWLLMEACAAAGLPSAPLGDLYRTLFDHSLRYGFDHRSGGFFHLGYLGAPAHRREKVWWVQAEGLLGALHMYRHTREERFFACFRRTLDWITKRQVDWEGGEWHATVSERGVPSRDNSGWKDPYHAGRAMMHGLAILEEIAGPSVASKIVPLRAAPASRSTPGTPAAGREG